MSLNKGQVLKQSEDSLSNSRNYRYGTNNASATGHQVQTIASIMDNEASDLEKVLSADDQNQVKQFHTIGVSSNPARVKYDEGTQANTRSSKLDSEKGLASSKAPSEAPKKVWQSQKTNYYNVPRYLNTHETNL